MTTPLTPPQDGCASRLAVSCSGLAGHTSCATSTRADVALPPRATFRTFVIGLIGFLTLVDLFATQAILPTLAKAYHVAPATMGVAVNASTMGMAISGLIVGLWSRRLDRRRGIWISLALLAIPTSLLAIAPGIAVFTVLRVTQGLFMAAAFTLTMAYLAEQCTANAAAGALAAYVTGGVASNLVGRLMAGSISESLGIATNFYFFAALNLLGAAVVFVSLTRTTPMETAEPVTRSPLSSWSVHLKNASLRASFGIGFLLLFAFIGTFTYVNFVLSRAPLSLSPMSLGFVYLVFLPSMITTPLAGRVTARVGARLTFWGAIALAGFGLPLLLLSSLPPVLFGLVLIGVGTFFAQATATGYVGRAAVTDRAAASGLYLASYYLGGLTGSAVIGHVFDKYGWPASVAGIAISLALAALIAATLRTPVSVITVGANPEPNGARSAP